MSKANNICQSCGLLLSKDLEGGGTNSDGSRSEEYCSDCFQYGNFTEPWLSAEQVKARLKGRLTGKGMPGMIANIFTPDVSRLRRWENSNHQFQN